MSILIISIFIFGYLAIVFEHKISIDKSATALLIGVITWAVVSFSNPNAISDLSHHISDIAGILFFLMAAMTIVELMDTYNGFDIITNQIKTRSLSKLLWIICGFSFLLSAILDNLTTAIIMTTLCQKLIKDKKIRLIFIGLVVVAANAGGAWSPMGDVTTTMLWIGGQVSALQIIKNLFLPSLTSMLIPMLYYSYKFKNREINITTINNKVSTELMFEKSLIFWVGLGGLIFVPIFKTITHLPPFMGMLLALGVVWLVAELIIKNKDDQHKRKFSVYNALANIDMPSILFFLGILLAVASLQSIGILKQLSQLLNESFKSETVIVAIIGGFSAVVDNVPLVAAAMGMYELSQFPMDADYWLLLAFCAGTGGSMLIIGSAAGVAAMGIEKIDFFWYIKNISVWAILGYFVGIIVFLLQKYFLGI